ncbi:MAG TPA: YraN family protein, partial [Clostridium sp.]|nr:YraN family protein [Clostridium sp.]
MKILNKAIGNYGENLAKEYIKEKGYIILDENFLCKLGEIDIIA